jgi:hypothetical protein
MNIIRTRLQQAMPDLFNAFERSWDIAQDEWLPAISQQNDSYNSYPHLRNLEMYLDKLLLAFENFHLTKVELFSPIEIYVLLMSILLHDIGRVNGSSEHGKKSRKLIREKWQNLGIPNEQLAGVIADVCFFHDCKIAEVPTEINNLHSTVIDPGGSVRMRAIAAVLMLLDHMDCTFLRTVPSYLKDSDATGISGAFRRKFSGVEIDLEGGMIKVVIGKEKWEYANMGRPNLRYILNRERYDNPKKLDKTFEYYLDIPSNDENNTPEIKKKLAEQEQEKSKPPSLSIFDILPKDETMNKDSDVAILIRNRNVFVDFNRSDTSKDEEKTVDLNFKCINGKLLLFSCKKRKESLIPPELPPSELLNSLLGDALDNRDCLREIRSVLNAIGIPLRGWLIEHKDHLFDCEGEETYEPIFSKDFLKNVAFAMWHLSTRVFGYSTLSYATLAAELREPNAVKVKKAVRRLAILSRDKDDYECIWCGDTSWQWKNNIKENNQCGFISLKDLINNKILL